MAKDRELFRKPLELLHPRPSWEDEVGFEKREREYITENLHLKTFAATEDDKQEVPSTNNENQEAGVKADPNNCEKEKTQDKSPEKKEDAEEIIAKEQPPDKDDDEEDSWRTVGSGEREG